MKRLSAIFALTFASSLHLTLACGDDDSGPSNSGGRSGASNTETGGRRTSGGTSNAGSTSTAEPSAGNGGAGESGSGGAQGGETSGTAGGSAGEAGAGGNNPLSAHIDGRVIDEMGSARKGVSVIVNGRSQLTDDQGRFGFEGIGESYDLLAFPTEGQTVFVYQGLTRRDPILVVDASDVEHTSSVSGKANFASPPASSIYGGVGLASRAHPNAVSPIDLKEQSYGPLAVRWTGSSTYQPALLALVWIRDDNSLPIEYIGFGSSAIELEADSEISDADVDLEQGVDTRSLAVNGALPEGYKVLRHSLEFGSIPLLDRQTDSLTGTYKVPSGLSPGDLVFSVESALMQSGEGPALQNSTAKWRVLDEQTQLDFELKAAPTPVLPQEGASGVNETTLFQWQPFEGGVHRLDVSWGDSRVVVFTEGTSSTLPDISVVGKAYPSDEKFRWTVSGVGPAKTLDEWVSTANPIEDFGAKFSAESEARSFTVRD